MYMRQIECTTLTIGFKPKTGQTFNTGYKN